MTEKLTPTHTAKPLVEGEPHKEGNALQVFVMTKDYYSNPCTLVVLASSETEAQKLLEEAQKIGYRQGSKGFFGTWASEKLFSLTEPGVYVFEAPGNRDFIR